MACLFELRGDNVAIFGCVHTKSNEGWRNADIAKRAAHGVFTTDRRQAKSHLHLECTKEGSKRFAIRVFAGHTLEVLLIREAHLAIISTCGYVLRTRFNHSISRTVVWTPLGNEGVVTEGKDTCGVGYAVGRQLLYRYLGLGSLIFTTERHEDG